MGTKASGVMQIGSWEESAILEWESGAKLARAHITATLSGDFEGESTAELLMAYTDAMHSSFTGVQVLDGGLSGRKGRFVLQLTGSFADGVATVDWTVVAESGTDELAGLAGSGGYVAGPGDFPNITITLDHEL